MFSVKKRNKKGRLLLTVEYPPDKGGVGRYLKSIADEVADIEVARPQFFKFLWPRWIKSLLIPFSLEPKELWISHLLPLGYVAWLYEKLTGTPYTIFIHGTDIQFSGKSAWKRFWAKIILNNAQQIIANSQYTFFLIQKLKIKNLKIEIIYPCPTFQPAGFFNKKSYSLLSVGRLVSRKGFAQGIKAVVQLKKEFRELTYTIIGHGPEYQNLKNIILENQAEQYIKIITDASDEVLQQYYAQSELLLAPGQEINGDVEGFGLVILEAAQFASPTVATNIGGVGEAIIDGQTGVLIPDNKIETITATVKNLFINNNLRQQMGENAKKRVVREFKMSEQIKKIL